ncbi:MAG: Gfo/Idh/MocA family oxidoreductase [Bacteroidales bacterium]
MIKVESALPPDTRPHIISIVTPNHLHYTQCIKSLDAGFNVICDKPLTISLTEALEIEEMVKASGLRFCITHNYTGHPMVKSKGNSMGRIDGKDKEDYSGIYPGMAFCQAGGAQVTGRPPGAVIPRRGRDS